jgi:hypothetical protein
MGNTQNINKISFFDMQNIIKSNPYNYYIINTLPSNLQHCLIKNTINYTKEEVLINELVQDVSKYDVHIIIYGMNANDNTILTKYLQLQKLGFINIYVYPGGLFEWISLKTIYGDEMFKVEGNENNILDYAPKPFFKKN